MRSRFGVLLLGCVSLLGAAACSGAFSAGGSTPDDGEAGSSSGIGAVSPDGGDATAMEGGGAHPEAGTGADGTTQHDGGLTDSTATESDVTGPEAGAQEAASCASGTIECGGSCVPSDVHDCGSCGHDCTNLAHVTGTATCSAAGACAFPTSACATGWYDCDGNPDNGCETDITAPAHCGSCSNACGSTTPVCASGQCSTGCPSGSESLCSGSCVDTSSSASNCKTCGTACPAGPANSQPVCSNSTCGFACTGVYTGCPTASPTACYDEGSDPAHCGSCTNACAPPTNGATGTAACSGGGCTLNCNPGLTACPATGVPTTCDDLTKDLSNCGSCGFACPQPPNNATEACNSKQCGFTCNQGFVECNTNSCVPVADTVNGAFVSKQGNDANSCGVGAPCATIGRALLVGKTIVYVDQGTYTEQVNLEATAAIHGGWTYSGGSSWTNCNGTNSTTIIAAPAGAQSGMAVVTGTSGTWTLDSLTIQNENTAGTAQSLYGVFVSGGSLSMNNVVVSVAAGGPGAAVTGSGTQGSGGAAAGTCASGSGGAGPAGPSGTAGTGSYTTGGYQPGNGGTGQTGSSGQAGTAAPAAPCEAPPSGFQGPCSPHCANPPSCLVYTCNCINGSSCPTAGGNGCGGGGGGGGPGGNGGGSSLGVFVAAGTVTFSSCGITVGAGGTGSDAPVSGGGPGGAATSGYGGGAGPTVNYACSGATKSSCSGCATYNAPAGGAGGGGGAGGNGGAGGGGAGGDSLCFATASGASAPNGSVTCTPGTAGVPGNSGLANQGTPGRAGTNN